VSNRLTKLIRAKFIRRLLTKIEMENEEKQLENKVCEMHKRRETTADGRRYIIYYTFGDEEKIPQQIGVKENV